MSRAERGYTLLELMIVVGILAFLGGVITTTVFHARRTTDLLEAASADDLAMRRTLGILERDLRESTAVATDAAGVVRIETARGVRTWSLAGAEVRRTADGVPVVLARNVAAFAVAEAEGWLRATLAFRDRVPGGRAPAPVTSIVARRASGGPR